MNSLSNKRNDAGVRDKLIFLFAAVSFCFPKAGTATAGLPLTVSMFLFLSALLANAKELTKKRFPLAYAILFMIMGVSSSITVLLNLGNITAMNIAYTILISARTTSATTNMNSFRYCMSNNSFTTNNIRFSISSFSFSISIPFFL